MTVAVAEVVDCDAPAAVVVDEPTTAVDDEVVVVGAVVVGAVVVGTVVVGTVVVEVVVDGVVGKTPTIKRLELLVPTIPVSDAATETQAARAKFPDPSGMACQVSPSSLLYNARVEPPPLPIAIKTSLFPSISHMSASDALGAFFSTQVEPPSVDFAMNPVVPVTHNALPIFEMSNNFLPVMLVATLIAADVQELPMSVDL